MSFDATQFYIDGIWVEPAGPARQAIINPATEKKIGEVALGNVDDVDRAVKAAKAAFESFAYSSVSFRRELLIEINEILKKRNDEIAEAISLEMGAPIAMARSAQAPSGTQHFSEMIRILEEFEFDRAMGDTLVKSEPVGVCSMVTPWNWPLNQIATKVAPALAAGCTMVLKPSEQAPLDATILAEIIEEVGVPAGVFNLIHGTGEQVGEPLSSHPDVDMVSFTGSSRAGVAISKNAAPTIKRVALELGGKSANIIVDDANFDQAIPSAVQSVMLNSGQSCNAAARLLVSEDRYDEVAAIAANTANALLVGPPDSAVDLGPVANKKQYDRVIALIKSGLDEGAELLVGGIDRPAGLEKGYFVKPTILGRVTSDMLVAREEIFGPVMTISTYSNIDDAIKIANDSIYGLSGAVWSSKRDRAIEIATKLRTGMVHICGAGLDSSAPFGGYKQSGNGREWGVYGLEEFLEKKSIYGGASSAISDRSRY